MIDHGGELGSAAVADLIAGLGKIGRSGRSPVTIVTTLGGREPFGWLLGNVRRL